MIPPSMIFGHALSQTERNVNHYYEFYNLIREFIVLP
jgi:hypothetical protein